MGKKFHQIMQASVAAISIAIVFCWHEIFQVLFKNDEVPRIFSTQNIPSKSRTFENSSTKKYITCTFDHPAGLGNQIWRFASLYGIGRQVNRIPYFDSSNLPQMKEMEELEFIFPNLAKVLHIKSPSESSLTKENFAENCCKFENPERISNNDSKFLQISGNYLQSYKFFHEYESEIRKILQCGPEIKKNLQAENQELFLEEKNSFKLCAHIRRGDFKKYLFLESKEDFVIPALEYAFEHVKNQQKNKDISLIFIGDDDEFARNLSISHIDFANVHFPNLKTRGEDMCFGIEYCDSMILTASSSTFGWWISYLMKPTSTIFYNSQITDHANFTKDFYDFDLFPKNWIKLTVENGKARKEPKWWYQRQGLSSFES